MQTVFMLSPAHCGGRRAALLMNPAATFPLAVRLRQSGAPLGEIFSFVSGLYFRGKLAYARAFARTIRTPAGVLVIVPGLGLAAADRIVTAEQLADIATVGVSPDQPRYCEPLDRDARALAGTLAGDDQAVLLGSIATGKYVDVLERCLAGRLRFPADFVGRGDLSRGGLMLRCVLGNSELAYVPVAGAIRTGRRPPRLEPRDC